jgi:hypothetical protein
VVIITIFAATALRRLALGFIGIGQHFGISIVRINWLTGSM